MFGGISSIIFPLSWIMKKMNETFGFSISNSIRWLGKYNKYCLIMQTLLQFWNDNSSYDMKMKFKQFYILRKKSGSNKMCNEELTNIHWTFGEGGGKCPLGFSYLQISNPLPSYSFLKIDKVACFVYTYSLERVELEGLVKTSLPKYRYIWAGSEGFLWTTAEPRPTLVTVTPVIPSL